MSVQSGFPDWVTFNRELMCQFLTNEIGNSTPAAMLALPNIQSAANELYEVLSRDAVADFVSRSTRKKFGPLLASVLYNNRTIDQLPLKSAHFQIASLSDKARLFTLNFDPLLELGLARKFPGREWINFRSPSSRGEVLRKRYKVEHLHGWIDPGGKMSPEVVLTESDYLDLTKNSHAPANAFLRNMLAAHNTTLILGMSLADPNFRRVLYFLNKEDRSSRERIYVVMRKVKDAIDHYAKTHWTGRGLRLLFVREYDDIPGLLRDIQWGEAKAGELPRWIKDSVSWRQRTLPDYAIFTDDWQRIAYDGLASLAQEIRIRFGIPDHEKINVGLFIPFMEERNEARLRMVASSRKFVRSDRALLRARERVFSIRKGKEQGTAGLCFATATNRAVAYGEGQVDVNFTPEMLAKWVSQEGYRDWRSIVAVAVVDTEYWIPVAVITITSNMATPFWKQFGSNENLLQPELYTFMRRTAHFCLVGWAVDS